MKFTPLILLSTLLLAGCASTPPNVIVLAPSVSGITAQIQQSTPLAITTLDTRKANFVVQFNQEDEAAKLVSPAEPPRQQIEAMMRQGFTDAGYQIDPASSTELTLALQTLLTQVDENALNYEASTLIIINVVATRGNQTLSKQFSNRGLRTGPFSADFASLELELNSLLAEISTAIITDSELNQFLTGANQ
ncbi:YajG family lipoprotein [Shewanella sp. NIFS-20-20]|uniref:YajG family lipoprotein n=1 Tax=Shewanella sp. NIFS-20-20 TaxID=2853806 RepID=UPI001C43854D|nr:YajG family lipoprotein [Shewanella sp. NIFS-20-20]MBV7315913.1 YajG family lipoprotein [Shewanella sp. NIFS-20-20]